MWSLPTVPASAMIADWDCRRKVGCHKAAVEKAFRLLSRQVALVIQSLLQRVASDLEIHGARGRPQFGRDAAHTSAGRRRSRNVRRACFAGRPITRVSRVRCSGVVRALETLDGCGRQKRRLDADCRRRCAPKSRRDRRVRGRMTMDGTYSAAALRAARRLRPCRFISATLQGRAGPLSKPCRMSLRSRSSWRAYSSFCLSIRRNASRTTSLAEL